MVFFRNIAVISLTFLFAVNSVSINAKSDDVDFVQNLLVSIGYQFGKSLKTSFASTLIKSLIHSGRLSQPQFDVISAFAVRFLVVKDSLENAKGSNTFDQGLELYEKFFADLINDLDKVGMFVDRGDHYRLTLKLVVSALNEEDCKTKLATTIFSPRQTLLKILKKGGSCNNLRHAFVSGCSKEEVIQAAISNYFDAIHWHLKDEQAGLLDLVTRTSPNLQVLLGEVFSEDKEFSDFIQIVAEIASETTVLQVKDFILAKDGNAVRDAFIKMGSLPKKMAESAYARRSWPLLSSDALKFFQLPFKEKVDTNEIVSASLRLFVRFLVGDHDEVLGYYEQQWQDLRRRLPAIEVEMSKQSGRSKILADWLKAAKLSSDDFLKTESTNRLIWIAWIQYAIDVIYVPTVLHVDVGPQLQDEL